MFILDSLMISGIRWALETALTAAEAEMNDDSVLREQLLETEMRREAGEITDDEFRAIEADLLARIREIKERREGAGPLEFGTAPLESSGDDHFKVEASISGDFHEPATAPHTTIVEPLDHHHAAAHLVSTSGRESIQLLDMEPGDAVPPAPAPVEPRRRSRAHGGSAGGPAATPAAPNPPHTGRRSRTTRTPTTRGSEAPPRRTAARRGVEAGRQARSTSRTTRTSRTSRTKK